jgi:hypothetical protein
MGHRSCLIADRDGIYDPGTPDGRLLLGLKGRDARLAGGRFLPALVGSGLAVGLHGGDDLLRHLFQIGDLVETDDVPDPDEPLGPWC